MSIEQPLILKKGGGILGVERDGEKIIIVLRMADEYDAMLFEDKFTHECKHNHLIRLHLQPQR